MKKDHRLAFPEVHLESERILVKLERTIDVADIEIDMIQSARLDHRTTSCSAGAAISTLSRYNFAICAGVSPSTSVRIASLSAPTREAFRSVRSGQVENFIGIPGISNSPITASFTRRTVLRWRICGCAIVSSTLYTGAHGTRSASRTAIADSRFVNVASHSSKILLNS